jgi:hypothetical protein
VVAEGIELADDLGGDVRLTVRALFEYAPEDVAATAPADVRGEALQHSDGPGHRLDRDPALGLAARVAALEDDALDPVPLDERPSSLRVTVKQPSRMACTSQSRMPLK